MFRIYVEKDPAETDSPCLVVQLGRREFFVWRRDNWPRFTTWSETK